MKQGGIAEHIAKIFNTLRALPSNVVPLHQNQTQPKGETQSHADKIRTDIIHAELDCFFEAVTFENMNKCLEQENAEKTKQYGDIVYIMFY